MKKTRKKLLATLALSCLVALSAGTVAACGDKEEGNKLVVEFLEGYVDEISLGDSILIKDYIPEEILNYKDKNGKKGYTLQIKYGETVVDLTNRATYEPDAIGDWKLVLTVGDEVKEITLEVSGRPLDWIYTKPENIEFTLDDPTTGSLDFATILADMKMEVYSDVDYETYISSVVVGTSDPVKTNLKGQTSYKFAKNDIHIFEFTTVAVDGQVVSDTFYAIPKTTEVKQYVKKDNAYPFRDWYKATSANKSLLKPDLATDGYYVDRVTFSADATVPERDWAGIKGTAKLFKKYVDAGAVEIKFDVYNPSATDNAYTLFHHLKDESLPEGSKGTLKAEEWTTITITKAMWEEAFAAGETDYSSLISSGVYGWSKKSFSTASNFAFSIALHYKGGDGKGEFYLDNVRVYDSEAKETKVGLLEESSGGEVTPSGNSLEDKFYVKGKPESMVVGVLGSLSASNVTVNTDVAYVKEGESSWKCAIGAMGTTYPALNFTCCANSKYAVQLDQIFADEAVTGLSFEVYNAYDTDITYEIGRKVHSTTAPGEIRETGTLKAGEWTTVVITRTVYEQVMADLVAAGENTQSASRFVLKFAVETAGTVYIDNFQIGQTA